MIDTITSLTAATVTISHNPREYSSPETCAHGINVLATTLLALAGRA